MDEHKSKEEEAHLAERGASPARAGKGGRRKAQVVSEWSRLVHSLGITEAAKKHGLFTKEGDSNGEDL